MRKLVIGLGMFVLVVAVLRRFGRPGMLERRDLGGEHAEPAVVLAGR